VTDGQQHLFERVRLAMKPPKKPPHRVITSADPQSAIAPSLDTWLSRLVDSNDALVEALVLLRDLYFSRETLIDDAVLVRVEDALDKAANAKGAF
jgi:hypothetical protein